MSGDRPQERFGFLSRLNALETVVVAFIALVALAGLMLIGKGYYLKTTTGLSSLSPQPAIALNRANRPSVARS